MKKHLFITIGISGSGKSHFFKNDYAKFVKSYLEKYPTLSETISGLPLENYIVEPDNFRKVMFGNVNYAHDREPWMWSVVDYAIKYRLDTFGFAVIDSCMVYGKSRNAFLKNIDDDVIVTALVFKNDYKLSISRISRDLQIGKDRSNVPIEILREQNIGFIRSVIGDYVDEENHAKHEWTKETPSKIKARLFEKFDHVKIIENTLE